MEHNPTPKGTRLAPRLYQPYRPFTVDELRSGLSNLPQELYDEIYSFVFAPPPTNTRDLNMKTYKPPIQLQVNRATRKIFSKEYYGASATWIFPAGPRVADLPCHCPLCKWWSTLDKATKALLCKPRPAEASPFQRSDAKNPLKGAIHRAPFLFTPHPAFPNGAVVKDFFDVYGRWCDRKEQGPGKLYEILQFLPESEGYDGLGKGRWVSA